MLVEERAARRKKEQRGASKHRQRAADNRSSENGFLPMHLSTLYLSTLDGPASPLVAMNYLNAAYSGSRMHLAACPAKTNFSGIRPCQRTGQIL
jgi:hypothetical protein